VRTIRAIGALGIAALSLSCSHATQQTAQGPDPAAAAAAPVEADTTGPAQPILPAREAFTRGWMPLAATGVIEFRKANPTYDGRGVLIGILIGLSRMAADSEITALRASGVGAWRFVAIVGIFAVGAFGIAVLQQFESVLELCRVRTCAGNGRNRRCWRCLFECGTG